MIGDQQREEGVQKYEARTETSDADYNEEGSNEKKLWDYEEP